MEQLIKELEQINSEIYYKFGTESYEIRCRLYDVYEKLKKDYTFNNTTNQ